MEISRLSKLCLESVSDNLAMWCESAVKEDFYKYLYTIGPFNELSPPIIQQLLYRSYDMKVLKASYFPLLFHEHFTKLDLSRCHPMISDQVLKLVCFRCKRLTHLILNGCSRLSIPCLNESLPSLRALRSLQLSNCRGCSDQLLHKLGKHCCNLQELVVNLCPRVTDVGIKALITNEDPDKVGCFEILHLNVAATSVTTKCLEVILERLPRLRKLCFSDVKADKPLRLDNLPLLNIEHLDIFATFLVDSDLKLLIDHCPKLTILKLNSSDNLNKFVSNHLMGLLHLKSLDLGGTFGENFFEALEMFLKKRGDQLESLNLSGMHNVRMSVFCLYCKSLRELILAHCQNVDPQLPAFDDLTKEQKDCLPKGATGSRFSEFCGQIRCINLNFTTFNDNEQPELRCVWMFGLLCDHPNLTELLLDNVDISDVVLDQVCGSSSSLALKTLNLANCNAITVQSVCDVIEKCRNLRWLDLSHCKQIDLGSVSQIKKKLKKTCNPLQIVWM